MSLICTMSDCPTCPIAGTKSYCPEGAGKESEYVKVVRCGECKEWDDGICWINSEEPDQISRGHYSTTVKQIIAAMENGGLNERRQEF